MRSFSEDAGDILAMRLMALALGTGFMGGGIGLTVVSQPLMGLTLMLIGCYVVAASLIGLRDGVDGWSAFARAGASALMGVIGLQFAVGMFPPLG